MQSDSYQDHFPTAIRISRDFTNTTISPELINHEDTLAVAAEDVNIAEIAPWATPNNGSEPVSVLPSFISHSPPSHPVHPRTRHGRKLQKKAVPHNVHGLSCTPSLLFLLRHRIRCN